jgi:transcriptional regulator of met regulon
LESHDHIGPQPSKNHVPDLVNVGKHKNNVDKLRYLTYSENTAAHCELKKKEGRGTPKQIVVDGHDEKEEEIPE